MIMLKLVSPTRGVNYSLEDALRKAFSRREFFADKIEVQLKHTCFYGSKDFYVFVDNLHVSEAMWGDSISFRIDGYIPIHQTANGKLVYGFGCGCDRSYGGEFPPHHTIANWQKGQEYIQEFKPGVITLTLKGCEPEVFQLSKLDEEDPEHARVAKLLCDIVKECIVKESFSCIF